MAQQVSEIFRSGELDLDDLPDAGGLGAAQISALECLLAGGSQAQAGTAANRSERWIWDQVHRDERFRTAYHAALNAKADAVRQRAIEASQIALESLTAIAADVSHKDCLRACITLLSVSQAK